MTHVISLFVIVVMVGMLSTALWALGPVEKVNQSQQVRVHTASTLIFH
ncbi:hypothetical protein LOK74_21670 [Brevibacillus humidisoli]|nr:hypothetical protein [Brevibacillus humidisoli]UFJ40596.1 hypothetical protein LOK74_21670 [Brevibacillus humidisoli]